MSNDSNPILDALISQKLESLKENITWDDLDELERIDWLRASQKWHLTDSELARFVEDSVERKEQEE